MPVAQSCQYSLRMACRIVARMGKRLPPGGVLWLQEKQPVLRRLERRMERAALARDTLACRRYALAWYRAWRDAVAQDIPHSNAFALMAQEERAMREWRPAGRPPFDDTHGGSQ